MKINELLGEEIKGWKHAVSDIARHRSAASAGKRSVRLVRLKKDGTESKVAPDRWNTFDDVGSAIKQHNHMVDANPGRKIAHHLYVDNKMVKELVDKVPADVNENATGGGTSAGAIASVANPMGAVIHRPNLFGYVPLKKKSKKK